MCALWACGLTETPSRHTLLFVKGNLLKACTCIQHTKWNSEEDIALCSKHQNWFENLSISIVFGIVFASVELLSICKVSHAGYTVQCLPQFLPVIFLPCCHHTWCVCAGVCMYVCVCSIWRVSPIHRLALQVMRSISEFCYHRQKTPTPRYVRLMLIICIESFRMYRCKTFSLSWNCCSK